MVVQESFVTRKPVEFTLIVLFIVLVLLAPLYIYMKWSPSDDDKEVFITESFNEVMYMFSPESDLSPADKRIMFRLEYEGNIVQWSGTLLSCDRANGLSRLSVDHLGTGFADVIFTTRQDCPASAVGAPLTYRMTLVDWKTTTFIGKDGEVIGDGS